MRFRITQKFYENERRLFLSLKIFKTNFDFDNYDDVINVAAT